MTSTAYARTTTGTSATTTDANGHRTERQSDLFGRLRAVLEYGGNNGTEGPYALYATTTYAYDGRDLLTGVTDAAGNTTTIGYDGLGRKTSMADPDMGGWGYTYNPAGTLATQTDAKGQVITFGYDTLDRLTGKTYSTGDPAASYLYDQNDPANGITVGKGRQTTAGNANATTKFGYDTRGRLVKETNTVTGMTGTRVFQWTYDSADRMATMTYPAPSGGTAETLTYSYDAGWRQTGVCSSNGGCYASGATYTALDQPAALTFGNGLGQSWTYSSPLQRLQNTTVSGSVLNRTYTYDDTGNVKTVADNLLAQTQTFGYDHRDRLTSASANTGNASAPPAYSQTYAFDLVGNLTVKAGTAYTGYGSGGGNSGHAHAPATIGGLAYTYDLNGNTLSGNGRALYWNAENMVTRVDYPSADPANGTLSGLVFEDRNNNGTQDAGEPGIGGVAVALGGAATQSTTTDASGAYSFVGLYAGTYTITETQASGYADGQETVGTLGGTAATNDLMVGITLPIGGNGTDYRFAERPNGNLAGKVYADLNNNGVQDVGEAGVSGVTLTLTGAASRTTTTGVDGSYAFDYLIAGTYAIAETQPASYFDGLETAGTLGGSTVVNDTVSGIVLPLNGTGTGYLFGDLPPGGLSGKVFDDINNNGAQDAGEAGIAGVSIALSGPTNQNATTATDGSFSFTNLPAGTYALTESQPTGWTDGSDTAGTLGGSIAVNDTISGIVVPVAASGMNYRFAERGTGSLSGVVYEDKNNNGVKDTGEGGLSGVALTLSGPTTRSATTDASGNYTFSNLPGGTFAIAETQPAGYLDGLETAGTLGGSTTVNDAISGIVLPVGGSGTNYRFGEQLAAVKDWGTNSFGQLGDASTTQRTTPVQAGTLNGATAIAHSGRHGLAVMADGTVRAWGDNGSGQLGDGTTTQRTSPVTVSGLTGIVAVAAGGDSSGWWSLAVKSDGTVWAWGNNQYGKLGDGTTTNRTTPVQVSGLTNVVAVSTGQYHIGAQG